MDRAYLSGASGSPPAAPGSPSIGYPTAGNPGVTPATTPGPYFYHAIMEELLGVIVAAGITPAQGTLTQLKQALDSLYSGKLQSIAATVASNALTLTLNPTSLSFRSNPLSSGVINQRTVPAAISLVVPSTATLGTIAATAARLALLAIDNAGTVELAVVNLAGGNNLDETTLISTTAISAAATAANVIYSTTARTNVAFRVVGFVDITEAVAGTWATAPSTIQGAGGQAFSALQSIGYGQTLQQLNGSRANNVTYYNTTGRPIMVMVAMATTSAGTSINATVNGVTYQGSTGTASTNGFIEFIVPPGASYLVSIALYSSLPSWAELR